MRLCLLSILILTGPLFAAKKPNILFAIADDWSFGHAGVYGCKFTKTPGFDRIAKEGLLFTRAYVPNAKCAPCRSCVLTGRNSWQLEEAANHICFFPPKFKGYVEALKDKGYFVGFTGKGWGPGIALDAKGNRREMTGKRFARRTLRPPARGISRNDYSSNFADFLKAAPKDKPWCFWYGTTEPHRGYQYGIGVKQGKNLKDVTVPKFFPDNEVIRNDILDYAVEVEHYDNHLSRILARLEKSGQLDNTIIVATSDHGMPFPRCKGQAYDYSNHVPLAILWKNGIKKPGRTLDDYVSLIDIAPTFVEVAGFQWKDMGMKPTTGRSLVPLFQDEKNRHRDHVLIGKERHDIGRPKDAGYPIRGIVKNDLLYIRNYETDRWPACDPVTGYLNCDGSPTKTQILNAHRKNAKNRFWHLCFGKRPSEEFYDLKRDPDCVRNLVKDSKYAKQIAEMGEQLVRELKQQKDPRMFGRGELFDRYVYSSKGTRNFYERYMKGERVRAGWVNPSDFEKK